MGRVDVGRTIHGVHPIEVQREPKRSWLAHVGTTEVVGNLKLGHLVVRPLMKSSTELPGCGGRVCLLPGETVEWLSSARQFLRPEELFRIAGKTVFFIPCSLTHSCNVAEDLIKLHIDCKLHREVLF